ncbi:uncharacterized protein MalAC0309_2692 [Microcella alkaliphila]|uniref:Uncharacterized protein n=1 Tax=Microcella alkaliphila TaxID=279828 RepID=A0A0U4NZ94_9MICO|nr:uncharacterized protein MalAC0309_2692 [Microcella alkaliphila]
MDSQTTCSQKPRTKSLPPMVSRDQERHPRSSIGELALKAKARNPTEILTSILLSIASLHFNIKWATRQHMARFKGEDRPTRVPVVGENVWVRAQRPLRHAGM